MTFNNWPQNFPKVLQLTTIAKIKNHPDYAEAKAGDVDAAYRLVRDLLSDKKRFMKIKEMGDKYPTAIVASIRAVEEAGKNKIPEALARMIKNIASLDIDENIVQSVKVGRTGSGEWHRLAFRPKFVGLIQKGREYILVDDVVARGGTFGELRYYIERHEAKVVHMVAGGAARYGVNIALSENTRYELERRYDIMALNELLEEFDIYGGHYESLTESEARKFLDAGTLDAARNRIIEARHARGRPAF